MKEVTANILEGKYEEVLASVQSPVISLTELIKNSADSCKNANESIVVNIDSIQQTISIADKGEGLSEHDIMNLGIAAFSEKMTGENIHSPIGNALSGSKGLGLLTAFFIADILEIETFSEQDDKTYFVQWKKGEQKYSYTESANDAQGTIVTLKNVEKEKLDMILLPEEKVKLSMSSIIFYNENNDVPKIQLIVDGVEEDYYPSLTLEDFYLVNKKSNNGFIAKASFKYENNKVYLSYEDNISNFYNFENEVIDLNDKKSVEEFVIKIKAPEKGGVPIKSICETAVFSNQFSSISVPCFSGSFYTWRGKKSDDLDSWPVGVRIYINNYSLYKYMDKDNDWINLSEKSQNLKATNYKLKNTYGYLHIDNYNENEEILKISKERNDFVDSLSQRKFIYIMRDVISGVFARIDIATKNPPIQFLNLRYNEVTLRVGEKFDLKNAVSYRNINFEDVDIEYDSEIITINESWIIDSKDKGTSKIKISFDSKTIIFTINYKNIIPEFELTKNNLNIYKGNTINLRDLITNCKDVTNDSISIEAENNNTIILDDLFDKNNIEGNHIIKYKYEKCQKTLVVTVKEIIGLLGVGNPSPRIDVLFPSLDKLKQNSFKIPELVASISSYYIQAPTLCMAGIRILLESSVKAFLETLCAEESDGKLNALVNKVINIRDCNVGNNDYCKIISNHDENFKLAFNKISYDYSIKLSRDVKKNINHHLEEIDLNKFVHNPNIIATDVTVYKSMQIFSPLLNYIFDILILKESISK